MVVNMSSIGGGEEAWKDPRGPKKALYQVKDAGLHPRMPGNINIDKIRPWHVNSPGIADQRGGNLVYPYLF